MKVPNNLDDASALAVSVARYGRGMMVSKRARQQPAQLLELYDMERCPYCRKVREALTELDLEYVARTCAKGASASRAEAIATGGKTQFPLLVDPNTGKTLYESEAIIDYLWETYGAKRSTFGKLVSPLNTASSFVASALRSRGSRVAKDAGERQQPPALPVLYNFEASPYCRKVREVLVELDLHHHVKNVGKRSQRRPELIARGGKMQVPYLIDPNTGVELYESNDIVAYLRKTYG